VSVLLNFFASSGSCILISSDAKIDSRYIHLRYTIIQISIQSETKLRSVSHIVTLGLMLRLYLLAPTLYSNRMLSSSCCLISSGDLIEKPLTSFPFLYTTTSKEVFFQLASILAMFSSFRASSLASLHISVTFS